MGTSWGTGVPATGALLQLIGAQRAVLLLETVLVGIAAVALWMSQVGGSGPQQPVDVTGSSSAC